MHSGMTMGHEFMGIVESKGPNVKSVSVGDRVVSSFDIACGQCFFCKKARARDTKTAQTQVARVRRSCAKVQECGADAFFADMMGDPTTR